jgi:excisionase family DNA binding protein
MPPITEGDLEALLTKDEAAAVLNVSRSTIDRMIRAQEIDVVRLGNRRGRVRITRRALLDHLNRREVRAAAATAAKNRGRSA